MKKSILFILFILSFEAYSKCEFTSIEYGPFKGKKGEYFVCETLIPWTYELYENGIQKVTAYPVIKREGHPHIVDHLIKLGVPEKKLGQFQLAVEAKNEQRRNEIYGASIKDSFEFLSSAPQFLDKQVSQDDCLNLDLSKHFEETHIKKREFLFLCSVTFSKRDIERLGLPPRKNQRYSLSELQGILHFEELKLNSIVTKDSFILGQEADIADYTSFHLEVYGPRSAGGEIRPIHGKCQLPGAMRMPKDAWKEKALKEKGILEFEDPTKFNLGRKQFRIPMDVLLEKSKEEEKKETHFVKKSKRNNEDSFDVRLDLGLNQVTEYGGGKVEIGPTIGVPLMQNVQSVGDALDYRKLVRPDLDNTEFGFRIKVEF